MATGMTEAVEGEDHLAYDHTYHGYGSHDDDGLMIDVVAVEKETMIADRRIVVATSLRRCHGHGKSR